MEIKKMEVKDRVYVLKRKTFPISFMLSSRNTRNKPLLYFDEEKKINRTLRYARNQKSPFEDEQDGNFILEPIIFEDGILSVPRNNFVLQQFLALHPDNGSIFEEFDTVKDASDELDKLDLEFEAQMIARGLDINTREAVGRILLGNRVDKLTSEELKRDIIVFAKRNASKFIDLVNDPELRLRNIAARALAENIFVLKNQKRDIYYNLPDNKKKLMGIPFGSDPIDVLASFLQSDDGIEIYKILDKGL
jgi:hypothetical protein